MRKKFLSLILATLLIGCLSAALAGCSGKNKKYDVSIKVVCEEVNRQGNLTGDIVDEIIFTPDMSEVSVERQYTKRTYVWYVYQYNLPDHPQFRDNWFTPRNEGSEVFERHMTYVDTDGNQSKQRTMSEKGSYYYRWDASHTSKLWNPRTIKLYITVT